MFDTHPTTYGLATVDGVLILCHEPCQLRWQQMLCVCLANDRGKILPR